VEKFPLTKQSRAATEKDAGLKEIINNIFLKEKFMKIALPSNQNQIDEHFGHCEHFTVFTIDGQKKITAEEKIASPAGCSCKSNIAGILAGKGVKLMLAGNMGQGAVNVLNSNGIDVLRGCSGDVKAVTENWLSGNLKDSGIACVQHRHDCQES
jgi:predicted Fe-Mo cluster-binding NifX family protein